MGLDKRNRRSLVTPLPRPLVQQMIVQQLVVVRLAQELARQSLQELRQ